MNFEPTSHELGYWLLFASLLILIFIFGWILISIARGNSNVTPVELKAFKVLILIAGVIAISGWVAILSGLAVEDRNLVSNIEQKYEIDEVLLSVTGERSYEVNASSDKRQPVYVRIGTKTYIYDLTQDKDTFEPTLTNPAEYGGSKTSTAPDAEDLLVEKDS